MVGLWLVSLTFFFGGGGVIAFNNRASPQLFPGMLSFHIGTSAAAVLYCAHYKSEKNPLRYNT